MSFTLRDHALQGARLGFSGQLHEVGSDWQILGNGYRVYSPVLQRYHSADNLSPFEEGGINAYAYGAANPVNFLDPSGHWIVPVMGVLAGGAIAAGAVAIASKVATDDSRADILGALAGVLAVGAAVAGLRALYLRNRGPQRGELIVRKGKKKDVVLVHGTTNLTRVGNSNLDGTEFSELLKQKGVGDKPIKLISCRSGLGVAPQGQVVSNATGQPVTAYEGLALYNGILGKAFGGSKVRFRPETSVQKEVTAIRNREMNRLVYRRR